jgi:hypothetical protein
LHDRYKFSSGRRKSANRPDKIKVPHLYRALFYGSIEEDKPDKGTDDDKQSYIDEIRARSPSNIFHDDFRSRECATQLLGSEDLRKMSQSGSRDMEGNEAFFFL